MAIPTENDGFRSKRSERSFVRETTNGQAILSKIGWRLIPLLFLCYVIAYVDRINVGFAKLHLREALGVEESVFGRVYGLGAGLFFVGYFLFEVPSNLILQRVGARAWIARIMIVWGAVSMATMFIRSTMTFYVMRFLLGAAEAGFFPGVILYLTFWYPAKQRARTVALFAAGGVAAGIVGSPLSGSILHLDGAAGLAGWQWLFLLEGVPAVLLGVVVLLILCDRPRDAGWLSEAEILWIEEQVKAEPAGPSSTKPPSQAGFFTSPRIWALCLVYFLLNIGGYGYELWLPSAVKGFSGKTDAVVGWISAIPYCVAAAAMLLTGRHSDRTGERRWHVALAGIAAGVGLAVSAYCDNSYLALSALILALAGIKSTLGPFWALTTSLMNDRRAAGGIALVNSVGNLGGFFGPTMVGIIKDREGSNRVGLLFLASVLFTMVIISLIATRPDSEGRVESQIDSAR